MPLTPEQQKASEEAKKFLKWYQNILLYKFSVTDQLAKEIFANIEDSGENPVFQCYIDYDLYQDQSFLNNLWRLVPDIQLQKTIALFLEDFFNEFNVNLHYNLSLYENKGILRDYRFDKSAIYMKTSIFDKSVVYTDPYKFITNLYGIQYLIVQLPPFFVIKAKNLDGGKELILHGQGDIYEINDIFAKNTEEIFNQSKNKIEKKTQDKISKGESPFYNFGDKPKDKDDSELTSTRNMKQPNLPKLSHQNLKSNPENKINKKLDFEDINSMPLDGMFLSLWNKI